MSQIGSSVLRDGEALDLRAFGQGLLTQLESPREIAPGLYRAALSFGQNKLSVDLSLQPERPVLRVSIGDALPDAISRNPMVQDKLHTLGDLVQTGLVLKEADGRAALEVDIALLSSRKALRPNLIEYVLLDCARLRGAAEGLAAAFAATQSPGGGGRLAATHGQSVGVSTAAISVGGHGSADVTKTGGAGKSASGLATRMFTVPSFDDEPAAAGPAQPSDFRRRNAKLVVVAGPTKGQEALIQRGAPQSIGRAPGADIVIADHSVSRKNSMFSWIDDSLFVEDLDSANGTKVNGATVEKRLELKPGDTVELGESRLRIDAVEDPKAPPVSQSEPPPPSSFSQPSSVGGGMPSMTGLPPMASSTGSSGAMAPISGFGGAGGAMPPLGGMGQAMPPLGGMGQAMPPLGGTGQTGSFGGGMQPLGGTGSTGHFGAGGMSPIGGEGGSPKTGLWRPPPMEGMGTAGAPAHGASAHGAPGHGTPAASGMPPLDAPNFEKSQRRASQFFGGGDGLPALDGPPKAAEPAADSSGRGTKRFAGRPFDFGAPALGDLGGGAPGGGGGAGSSEASSLNLNFDMGAKKSEAPPEPKKDEPPPQQKKEVQEALSWMAEEEPAEEKKDDKQDKKEEGGEELLDWMDSVEDEPSESGSLESESPAPRKHSFAIPEKILPKLRELALEWYHHPDRVMMKGELKADGESLFVETIFEPGDDSWRYRKPRIRLSKPPVKLELGEYVSEPSELSHDEVASWLISEGALTEQDVAKHIKAKNLLERAWVLRSEGDPDAAIQRLEAVLDIFPDDEKTLTTLGHICRKELELPKRAAEYYKRALAANSKFSQALLGRAMLLLDYDRHKAADAAMQALKLTPDDPDGLELGGLIQLKAGRQARARDIFLRLYRRNRERGEKALSLIASDRDGPSKWDARLCMVERRSLEAGSLDAVQRAMCEERVETANRIERFLRRHASMEQAEKTKEINKLAELKSFSFLFDLLDVYSDEKSDEVKKAIEHAFAKAPKQGAVAIEDAIRESFEPTDRCIAGIAIAAQLGWKDAMKHIVELFRRTSLPRDLKRLAEHMMKFSGPRVAFAFIAKLERGHVVGREKLVELIELRPDEGSEEAASALRELLSQPNAIELGEPDRETLVKVLGPEPTKGVAKKAPASKVKAAAQARSESDVALPEYEEAEGGGFEAGYSEESPASTTTEPESDGF